ncbi:MAG: hypothetical protein ACLTEH_06215, partial [Clostridia bacterium]
MTKEREDAIRAAEALDGESITFIFDTPILTAKENDFKNFLRHFDILGNSSVYNQSGKYTFYRIDLTTHPNYRALWN